MLRRIIVPWALAAVAATAATAVGAAPLASTREDFRLPGTQPLEIVDPIATPDTCAPCHSGFGDPVAEPLHNWQGSMMAQAGRDPMTFAALAISNQDAPESGETCLRCHLPKGWLEGRSFQADGSAMTADDRQGVQCGVCHRLVDPIPAAENPPEDTSILAGLAEAVTIFGGATMVADPFDRRRGPFDIVGDLGGDPHLPASSTLVSPFHASSDMCGVCHNLRNPIFTKNDATGEWELNPMDTPSADPGKGFPEQSTFDEWAASEYASAGVDAPQFGGNKTRVSTCQDCHMPDVTGRDASFGLTRNDVPRHTFAGANTFVPRILPHHPAFGVEVDPEALEEGIAESVSMLRKAATVEAELVSGELVVRVFNETGHKLPTGYPEGRRMWLHVRALDESRNIVFESGRYVLATATLQGYGAESGTPEHDPHLRVWEAEQGISDAVATATGKPAGRSFNLSLNNVRLKDNRIPPRGFTNAGFAAVDAEPVGASYADGQYWDEVRYPVGAETVAAEVTLYYQTTSREYVEFLRDENTTTAAGNILYDLWEEHGRSEPVVMAQVHVAPGSETARCRKNIGRQLAKYQKSYYREWSKCFAKRAAGLFCDSAKRDVRIAARAQKLSQRLGGSRDRSCTGANLTPGSLGHTSVCPVPCSGIVLFDMSDLASCGMCLANALSDVALEGGYGSQPPALPSGVPSAQRSCQRKLDAASGKLAVDWAKALDRCELADTSGTVDCSTDPGGDIARAVARSASRVHACGDFTGLSGCAEAGDAAAVQQCIENGIGALVAPYTEVAHP